MIRLTDREWTIMEVLWGSDGLYLGEILEAVSPKTGWSRNTVHTYLTRMISKGLVRADGETPRHYLAAVTREACADRQRKDLLNRVYQGSAGKLVMSFVKDGSLTSEEREELRRLLDEMEV